MSWTSGGWSTAALLAELKEEFYEWCQMISLEEVVSNPRLLRLIERMERMLIAAGS